MYVVKYKERVILGIIPWDNKYIMDVMRSRYNVTVELPYLEPAASEFPLQIDAISAFEFLPPETITIYPAEEDRDININPMIQYYYGPTWEFLENKVISHYEIRPLDLPVAKQNYLDRAALYRYQKEIEGIRITLNNSEYFIETDRESRIKYIEKYVSMQENETVMWKFSEGWVSLTKQDFNSITTAIDSYVQSAFDWEYAMTMLINSKDTLNDLLEIEELNLVETQENLNLG